MIDLTTLLIQDLIARHRLSLFETLFVIGWMVFGGAWVVLYFVLMPFQAIKRRLAGSAPE